MVVDSLALEWYLDVAEALVAWRRGGSGCALLLGSWADLEQVGAAAEAARVPVHRLNRELLARLPEPEALMAGEAGESGRGGAVRAALQAAWEQWLAEAPEAVVVRDLELLVGERLDLSGLAHVAGRVLLVAPGVRAGRSARLYGDGPRAGVPLPPSVVPSERIWCLTGTEASAG